MLTFPQIIHGIPPAKRAAALRLLPELPVLANNRHFLNWAHDGQLPPDAAEDGRPWRTWVLMAGRGFGKTRAGAEWVLSCVRGEGDASNIAPRPSEGWGLPRGSAGPSEAPAFAEARGGVERRCTKPMEVPAFAGTREDMRIALVAATIDEARRVMVEGASGILACAREDEILEWAPSRRELVFANGAVATLFSGASPEALRGPQHHIAWCDELAKWRHPDLTWDMLQLGLRCGDTPRALVTTTPKGGCAALARILEAPDSVETGGSTRRNPHLPAAFIDAVERAYGGTRMGREEIEGEFLRDVHGTLWPAELIERCRSAPPEPGELARVVVGVDPPASASGTCGIVVCGLDRAGVGHVLADWSESGLSPEGWAQRVAAAAEAFGADRIVAENNQGGDMVKAVLRGCFDKLSMSGLRIQPATATKSKPARAEPIAGRFESGGAKLAGRFPALEAELAGLVPAGYQGPGKSPDRADAMVWALWALLIAPGAEPRVSVL